MLSVFDRLLSNKSLVDVTLGCEGKSVKAHKVVLSACSPFFETLFCENPCKHPIVILKDIRYIDLKALVEFMYKGEVNVSQEQLPALLKTAEALKIKGLAEVTGDQQKGDAPSATVTPRPDSPSRRKRQRLRRKSTDSAGHSDSEESNAKASRTEADDDASMDAATSADDASQPPKDTSVVQSSSLTVNTSLSTAQNGTTTKDTETNFEPTRLLEQTMTTADQESNQTTQDSTAGTGTDNPLSNLIVPSDSLDIKPIITFEEGATPAGAIVPAGAQATPNTTGTDPSQLAMFPAAGTAGAAAIPGPSNYQASPQSHGRYRCDAPPLAARVLKIC